jgi:hypothetical protein
MDAPAAGSPDNVLAEHHGRFLQFLRRRVESDAVAEDILQEAYARSLEKLDDVRVRRRGDVVELGVRRGERPTASASADMTTMAARSFARTQNVRVLSPSPAALACFVSRCPLPPGGVGCGTGGAHA